MALSNLNVTVGAVTRSGNNNSPKWTVEITLEGLKNGQPFTRTRNVTFPDILTALTNDEAAAYIQRWCIQLAADYEDRGL